VAGKLEGKVAFITGAARGQGRSHAIRLASEGANVIAVDICGQVGSVAYPMSTPEDLAETVKEVEALDRRIVARQADVRDEAGLKAAFEAGVLTSSTAGINGIGGPSRGGLGYTASKHGVVGLMRSYANTLAPHRIRVNSVHPTGVNTPMVVNEVMQQFLESDPQLSNAMANALPVDMIEAVDISNAIVWLVSDDARYVTGVTLPVDAGFTNKK
jgi:NAD(P)-dependent dehydrogenase (short-subunit alcohol dehydrogenase family)